LAGFDTLVNRARAARLGALAEYSGFKVGAAIETVTGQIISGCNIENATYGLTMCAERVAIYKALSDGHRDFRRVVVVADTPQPTPPCGACRQILWEYAPDAEVVLANLTAVTARYTMRELLPAPFDKSFLR
jgi:cytidine deaminase